jgi:hypothetical protein
MSKFATLQFVERAARGGRVAKQFQGGGSAADFGRFIGAEIEKWGKVIRAANIKPE